MSRFKTGELLTLKEHLFGTSVWAGNLEDIVDSLDSTEVVTVVRADDDYGWTSILTQRGKVGFVHRNNLAHSVQSRSGTV